MAKRQHKTTDVNDILIPGNLDEYTAEVGYNPVPLPAHKQTQDRLIRLETTLLGRLTALADEIETGTSGSPRPDVPEPPYLSLSEFNKALPSRLTGLQEDLEHQINRIRSLLF